jgi:hypothetical protein
MTDLTSAAERMARAVERLEQVARRQGSPDQPGRVRLAAELKRAKADMAQLETVTEGVSLRLDGAIDRLRSALDD